MNEGHDVWGKLTHSPDGHVLRSQSLAAHCRDVSAVFSALIRLRGIDRRLARLAGRPTIDATDRARLAYLVHLHDCGKVNTGFQARRDRTARVVGHIAPLAALFGNECDAPLAARAYEAIAGNVLETWGEGAPALLDAIFSHHGRPWPRWNDGRRHATHWHARNGYDPIAELQALREDADRFLPDALSSHSALPSAPRFVHAVAGLAQLADWIASSGWELAPDDIARTAWAEQRVRAIGLDPEPWRTPLQGSGFPDFRTLFGGEPYVHQELTATTAGQVVVLESETGSGKTEAALWRFARLFADGVVDGLYFALPTRTAAAQLHARVTAFAARLWPNDAPPVVLAVPGYLTDQHRGAMPAASDPLDGPETDTRGTSVWAAEHPKRYFAALISVGTIDQALLATLRVKHAHMRGAALMRHLLVVDEVHASDAYMRGLLTQLLRDHTAAGGHALLLSATLGAEARHALLVEASGGRTRDTIGPTWLEATRAPYPLLSAGVPASTPRAVASCGPDKTIAVTTRSWLDEPEAIAAAALAAAYDGAKVLVVRNTVDGAVGVQRALEGFADHRDPTVFRVRGIATLHHGRFAREDRRLLDHAVISLIGRTRAGDGVVLVGTQTLEQSLDIDADLLITDLCPIDVLLQRIGRLHRHVTDATGISRKRPRAYQAAQVMVIVPAGGLTPFLKPTRPSGLRRHGLGHRLLNGVPEGVYRDLTVLEMTRRLIEARACWRIPAMNRELVEGALHSDAVAAFFASLPTDQRDLWETHWRVLMGDRLSQNLVARDGMLVRDRAFMDESNTRFDDHLVTRLGANDRLVDLPAATVGPFGEMMRRLAVPSWLAPNVDPEAVARVTHDAAHSPMSRALRIELGDVALTYDRHGLRPAEEPR